ncbi:divalent metal cation (Fe/Co/Zn/Cd) transporter [Fontibacillus solani]|uniref:Divalent metal cation (Fe/Co/Zn/Cd) transporter n=1 Tax=Fontibacillus solani TaxID=1572857 RepID=A0A7W3XSA2_9BACL|nr:hypothetical protein [Fontibacillus solani]MBA9086373.1 divalent metal cation (Fe/Co/Zn/Cd) transporter [Fontibacillus solani]
MSKLLRGIGAFFIVLGFIYGLFFGIRDQQIAIIINFAFLGLIPGILFIAIAIILDRQEMNRRYLEEILSKLPEVHNGRF